jgi:hypothetical protein
LIAEPSEHLVRVVDIDVQIEFTTALRESGYR